MGFTTLSLFSIVTETLSHTTHTLAMNFIVSAFKGGALRWGLLL
jgi:hypothetical protein